MDDARYEEVRQWLVKSQRDLKVAYVLLSNEESLLDSAVYHCQQAAEKALKAYLTYQNAVVRRTHDLDVLIELCALSEPGFRSLESAADTLTPYAIEFRYPGDTVDPGRDEAEEAIKMAELFIDFVVKNLPDRAVGLE